MSDGIKIKMRIENDQLKNFINDSEMIKSELLEEAYKEAQERKVKLGELLVEKKLITFNREKREWEIDNKSPEKWNEEWLKLNSKENRSYTDI